MKKTGFVVTLLVINTGFIRPAATKRSMLQMENIVIVTLDGMRYQEIFGVQTGLCS